MRKAIAMNGVSFHKRHLEVRAADMKHTGFRPSLQAAGTHTPALLKECVAHLVKPDPHGVIVDATFGRGGHSRGMLSALSPYGALHLSLIHI